MVCKLKDGSRITFGQNVSSHEIQISKQKLARESYCQVRFWTAVGPGPWSQSMQIDYIHTEVDTPTQILAIRLTECCMKITWKWNPDFLLSYSKFSIKLLNLDTNDTDRIIDTTYPSSLAYIDALVTSRRYAVQVRSVLVNAKHSPWSQVVSPTMFSDSWPTQSVHYPKCVISSFRSITLHWMFPYNVENLSHFRINFTGITNYTSHDGQSLSLHYDETENSLLFISGVQEYKRTIDFLKPNTEYYFDIEPIFCVAMNIWTVSTRTTCHTWPEAPISVPEPKIIQIDKVNLVVHLLLTPPSTEYGPIKIYYLVVIAVALLPKTTSQDVVLRTRDMIESLILTKADSSEMSTATQARPLLREINATKLLQQSQSGKMYTYPLGYADTQGSIPLNRPLTRDQDYRAVLVTCVKNNIQKETIRKLCSISPLSELINPTHSRPFPLPNLNLPNSKASNDSCSDPHIITGVVLTCILIPLGFCSVAIFLKLIFKQQPNHFVVFQRCMKFRSSSQDYYPDTGNELKENLVNPLISSVNAGSSYSAQKQDSLELKRYHISSTPDLLVQSSPSTSFKVIENPFNKVCQHTISHHKVPVALFHEYIANLKSNDNRGFSLEYESIDHANQFSWENSNKLSNKAKNRYANVVAYDHSRVVLQGCQPMIGDEAGQGRGHNTDYINANYINGYRKQNAYIATQGPLSETIGDFWRMIWEQRSLIVVMMTLLVERSRSKCEQYWPKGNKGSQCTYGDISVIVSSVQQLAYFVCRSFIIQRVGSPEKREIRHFQFTAWPDHGVPRCTIPFLMFVNRIKKETLFDSGPMVVHCSAGVGRTGAFVTVDSILEQIKHEKYLDIYSYVTHIRSQRNYMVQTEEQYIFIHDVLLDHLQSVNLELTSEQLFSQVEKLSKIDADSNSGFLQMTGFQLEYRRLLRWSSLFCHVTMTTKSECSTKSSDSMQQEQFTINFETALLNINQSKNRNQFSLPQDINRVLLRPIKSMEGSDYINASWIDGYRSRKDYIAAQCPMKETVEDFWRMLWEHDCGIVITLNDPHQSSQYWPDSKSARYQFFVVDPVAEYHLPHYTLKEFKLTDARDGQTRILRQFQFVEWIEDSRIPMSTESFLELIIQVHKTREQFGQNGPITVHCCLGSSRTGIFISLSILLQKLKEDNCVNIFEIFKLLKWQRPSLIETEDQYQFCFAALLEYLTLYSDDSTHC